MSRQFFSETISWATADGAAIANSAAEAIIFPNIVIPGNMMADGRVMRMVAFGRHGTTATPTLTFRVRWGGVAGTILCASGAIVTGATVVNAMWRLEVLLQTRTNGVTGTIFGAGIVHVGEDATSAVGSATNTGATDLMGSAGVAAPAAVTTDLTIDTSLSLTAQWGTANALNTLTGHIYTLELMN